MRRVLSICAGLAVCLTAAACTGERPGYAKPAVGVNVTLGEYGAVPSEAPGVQPGAPLPPPPPPAPPNATPAQQDKAAADAAAYETLKQQVSAIETGSRDSLLVQVGVALSKIDSSTTLTPEQKAALKADLTARRDALLNLPAGGSAGPGPIPLGGGPAAWLQWGLALVVGGGSGYVATQRLRAALRAWVQSDYEGQINGQKVSLTEAQMVAAAAHVLGVTPPVKSGAVPNIQTLAETPDPA